MLYSKNQSKVEKDKSPTLPAVHRTAMDIEILKPTLLEIKHSQIADSKICVFRVSFQDYDFRYTKNTIIPERVFESYHVPESEELPAHILLTLPIIGKSRENKRILQEVGEKIKRVTNSIALLPSTRSQLDFRTRIILRDNVDHQYIINLIESKFFNLFENMKNNSIFYTAVNSQELDLSKYPRYKLEIF